MSEDHTSVASTHIRRQDRAVNEEAWIRAFLHRAAYGVMATVYEGQPFINSNLFVYDEKANAIYLHTARAGRTLGNVEHCQRVCFSVSEMGRLLPAKEALEFSLEYAGVTVFGSAEIVDDPAEAKHGLQRLLDKYAPHLRPERDYRPITLEELKRTAVYRIDIERWSGKKKEEAADFPGAFVFGDHYLWHLQEYQRHGLFISTDPNKLDTELIYDFLATKAYWSRGVTREQVNRFVKHSLCFGVFEGTSRARTQIGFARVISDFTLHAHLVDVFVVHAFRGRGIGKWLLQCILAHPELQNLRRWSLNTRDAHELYRQFGFKRVSGPDNLMVLKPNDPNW